MISSLGLRAAAWEDDLRPVRLRISGDHPGDGDGQIGQIGGAADHAWIMLDTWPSVQTTWQPLGTYSTNIFKMFETYDIYRVALHVAQLLRPIYVFCPSKSSASSVNILQLAIHSHHHILPQKPPIPRSGSGSKLAIPQEPGHMENLVNPTINLQKFGHGLCQCMVILRMVYVLPHSSTLFTILHPSKCQDSVGMKTRSDLL